MRKALTVAALIMASFTLTGCDDMTEGKVLNIYGPDVTQATTDCPDWSMTVLTESDTQVINCISGSTAAKYAVGDQYPGK